MPGLDVDGFRRPEIDPAGLFSSRRLGRSLPPSFQVESGSS
jgi:hypothetical protein